MRQKAPIFILAICFVTSGAAMGPVLAAKPIERLTAFAVDMSNAAGRTRAGSIDIVIDRWSTDAERDQLRAALREGGPDSLLRALQKIKDPAGYIRSAGSIGYPLAVRHQQHRRRRQAAAAGQDHGQRGPRGRDRELRLGAGAPDRGQGDEVGLSRPKSLRSSSLARWSRALSAVLRLRPARLT